MTRRRALLLIATLLAAARMPALAQPTTAAPAVALSGAALVTALHRGGYVLYFRHTSTDFGENDSGMTSYEDCKAQRNLTEAGRAEARAIGAQLRRLGIKVDRVLASPFCRTMETGRLIFGNAEASRAVLGGPADDSNNRYAGLRALISTPLAPGANLAIASHGNPFRAVVAGSYLQEGEAAVIEPLGKDGFRIVARVTKDDWAALPAP